MRCLVLLVGVGVMVGCAPSWEIVKVAKPNPLLHQKPTISLAPVAFEVARIRRPEISDEDWAKNKQPSEQPTYDAELARSMSEVNRGFFDGLRGGDNHFQLDVAGQFVVKARVVGLRAGYNDEMTQIPVRLKMLVAITDPDGKTVDEIEVTEAGNSDGPMSTRLHACAGRIGRSTAAFINARTVGTARKTNYGWIAIPVILGVGTAIGLLFGLGAVLIQAAQR